MHPLGLASFFEPVPDIGPEIDGKKYDWLEMYGRTSIVRFATGKTKVRDVYIRDHPYLGYREHVNIVHEAWLYHDGSILLCATASSFAGTFASHDDISVKYYGLTPRE